MAGGLADVVIPQDGARSPAPRSGLAAPVASRLADALPALRRAGSNLATIVREEMAAKRTEAERDAALGLGHTETLPALPAPAAPAHEGLPLPPHLFPPVTAATLALYAEAAAVTGGTWTTVPIDGQQSWAAPQMARLTRLSVAVDTTFATVQVRLTIKGQPRVFKASKILKSVDVDLFDVLQPGDTVKVEILADANLTGLFAALGGWLYV